MPAAVVHDKEDPVQPDIRYRHFAELAGGQLIAHQEIRQDGNAALPAQECADQDRGAAALPGRLDFQRVRLAQVIELLAHAGSLLAQKQILPGEIRKADSLSVSSMAIVAPQQAMSSMTLTSV